MKKEDLLAVHAHCAPCLHEHVSGTCYVYEEAATKRCHVRAAGTEEDGDFVVTSNANCHVVAIDNCVLARGGQKKCDLLVFSDAKACFVEIKRGGLHKLAQHISKGAKQIDATIRRFIDDQLIGAGDEVEGIVSTKLAHLMKPQLTASTQLARIKLKEAYSELVIDLLFADEVVL